MSFGTFEFKFSEDSNAGDEPAIGCWRGSDGAPTRLSGAGAGRAGARGVEKHVLVDVGPQEALHAKTGVDHQQL